MAKNSKQARLMNQKDLTKTFVYWALAIFLIKIIIASNVTQGIWYGADGENYLKALNGLLMDGVFSKESTLNYWPAGYPLVIYLLSVFGKSWVLTTLSIMQSAIFSFSVYFFAKQLARTRLKNYSYFVFILILINPTLSLSSLVVGYESLAVSGALVATGLIIKDLVDKQDSKYLKNLISVSFVLGILAFMQPRLIVGSIGIIFIWCYYRKPRFVASISLIIATLIMVILPSTLIYRNLKSTGLATVSTNLGVTMNIGAGDNASGGYGVGKQGVNCEIKSLDIGEADSQRVICVLKWYVSNLDQTPRLFLNKSVYFWSPWSGPLASGTMFRNPWLKISPIKSMENNPEGIKTLLSPFGRFISWAWLFGGLILLFYGFVVLWNAKHIERIVGLIALTLVLSSWTVTLLSIGDHRFRLPIMGASLFLQAIGFKTLFRWGKLPMADAASLR